MCMGEIPLPRDVVWPGEIIETQIRFIGWPELSEQIFTGATWRIQEGAKLVGLGEILEFEG